MPTSASRTSDRSARRRRRCLPAVPGRRRLAAGGFTLLELLVVITLVAILTGTVILGFTGADTEQRLRGSAEQLAYTIELARQHALQRNREWGMAVEEDAVQFLEFDPEEETWVEQVQRPFDVAVPANVALRVESEGLEALPEEQQEDLPAVLLFSSGEVTPFTVHLEPGWDAPVWTVHSDGIARARAERARP
jgi:type II secretion system protein H